MLTRAEALGGLHAGEPHVEELRAGVELAAKPQEEEALQFILGHLDTLAHRKQTGDPTVQAEIEAVRKMMIAQ